MLQIDVAAPAEQDQRDVERQRGARDLDAGAESTSRATMLAEEGAAVPISRTTAAMRMPSTSAVVARAIERRAAFARGEPPREHEAVLRDND